MGHNTDRPASVHVSPFVQLSGNSHNTNKGGTTKPFIFFHLLLCLNDVSIFITSESCYVQGRCLYVSLQTSVGEFYSFSGLLSHFVGNKRPLKKHQNKTNTCHYQTR